MLEISCDNHPRLKCILMSKN